MKSPVYKVNPKSKFPAGLGGKNGWAVPNWIQTLNFSCDLNQYIIGSAQEKFGVWTGP